MDCPRTQRVVPLHTTRDPRVLNCCLCSHFRRGDGADEISITASLSSSLSTAPPSSTVPLPEVSGDSWPCSVAPPFTWRLEERGRKREAPAHYQHVPRGPQPARLAAPPAAQYSCGTRPRPAGISGRGACESSALLVKPSDCSSTVTKPACWC
ncbi:hypothetical protein OJAV_G00165660 [Oryzias javanicus]|uniref:Uncharacterized protein n=1 Tax=Oryzias javanicus TaxID=123683 RepID=A0A3S2MAH1_ORYJA|nr:hypothetical protein OJAV_G00165660 [Oryzias javanicus]